MAIYYFLRVITIFLNYCILFLGTYLLNDENFQLIFGYLAAFQLFFIKFHEVTENYVLSAENYTEFSNRVNEAHTLIIGLVIASAFLFFELISDQVIQFIAFSSMFLFLFRPICILRYKKLLTYPILSMQFLPLLYVLILILTFESIAANLLNSTALYAILILCIITVGHKTLTNSIVRLRKLQKPTLKFTIYIFTTYVVSSWFAIDILVSSYILSAGDFVSFRISVGLSMFSLLLRQFMSYEFFSRNVADMKSSYNKYRLTAFCSSLITCFIIYTALYSVQHAEILRDYELQTIMQIFLLQSIGTIVFASLGPFYAYASKLGIADSSFQIFVGGYLVKLLLLAAATVFAPNVNGTLYALIGSISLLIIGSLHHFVLFRFVEAKDAY